MSATTNGFAPPNEQEKNRDCVDLLKRDPTR